GLNVDVGRRADEAAGDERLVNEHAGVRVDEAAALLGAGEQDGAHGGGHAGDDHGDGGGDHLHGVIDGHAGGDGTARGVHVEGDLLAGSDGLQVEQLFGDVLGGLVGDGAPEEDFP